MTRTPLAILLSSACALAACQGNSSADNDAMASDDINAMTANDLNGTAAAGTIDQQFVTDSIKGDTAEIAIGELAAAKGTSQAVKDFGTMLATDHGAHKQKLIDLANAAGVAVPTEPAEAGKANLDKLQGLSGADFDKQFATMMVDSHHKGIAKNEAQAKSSDAQTAKLAQETLPTLRKHLGIAEGLAK